MKLYGYIGITIVILAEVFLFAGYQIVGHWFTPVVWTGYILLVDAFVFKIARGSLLTTHRLELLVIAMVSIAVWWLFEFYNTPRFWQSNSELWWHYHNLQPNPYLRRLGYDWAFATIFPAIFLTARLLMLTVFANTKAMRRIEVPRGALYLLIGIGTVGSLLPLIFISGWLAPAVWLSFIFLLDPINYLRGWPSIFGDLKFGSYKRLLGLLLSGGLCGIFWEFWNYWALSKWTYTVPYLGNVKIFEMPVLGYLGFPPFAVECWVIYVFFRSLLKRKPDRHGDREIWLTN
ncbi:MAG: hypothetical protein M3Y84_08485 [Acidobacteriota bacterium]|nr:hypothetical protein [Acidobacteriota bacterium]